MRGGCVLVANGPVDDPSGHATSVRKDLISYAGSAVTFIQLIAAMDRDGEISRQIRGRRTYRITATAPAGESQQEIVADIEAPRAERDRMIEERNTYAQRLQPQS